MLDERYLDWMVEYFLKEAKTFEISQGILSAAKNVMVLKTFLTESNIVKGLVFKDLKMTKVEIGSISNLLECMDADQLKTLTFER